VQFFLLIASIKLIADGLYAWSWSENHQDGKEQAEAQGAQSAVSFEPIPTTLTF
jgi:hypothetical protein